MTTLIALNTLQESEKFVKKFQARKGLKIDPITEPNIVSNLIYYNEVLILHHKIKSIHNPEIEISASNRIARILDA